MTDKTTIKPPLSVLLSNIQPTNTLQNASIVNTIVQTVRDTFSGVNLSAQKLNPDFILYICNLVENSFDNTKTMKVNKKDLVINIIDQLLNLTDEDKLAIGHIIEFVHSTGQIIKVISKEVKATSLFQKITSFLKINSQNTNNNQNTNK